MIIFKYMYLKFKGDELIWDPKLCSKKRGILKIQ